MSEEFRVFGEPSSRWAKGQADWGTTLAFRRDDPGMAVHGGTGKPAGDLTTVGMLQGEGPPILYELRMSPLWGDPVRPAGPGLLKAQVTVGVGAARHIFTCDCELGASVLVPVGRCQVDVFQTGDIQRALQSIAVSIARVGEAKPQATDSYVYQGVAGGGVFTVGGVLGQHIVGVRLTALRSLGVHTMRFFDQFANIIAEVDTGTDPELVRSGVAVPRGAVSWSFIYPNTVSRPPVVSWLLDC